MGRQSLSTPPRTPPASWVGRGSIVPGARRPNGAALSARPHHSVTQPPALTPESMPGDHRLGPSASSAVAFSRAALMGLFFAGSFFFIGVHRAHFAVPTPNVHFSPRQGPPHGRSLSWSRFCTTSAQDFRILTVGDYAEAPRGS